MTESTNQDDDFIVFGSPDIQSDEIDEVIDSLKSGWIGTGPKVARFESDFAIYKGVNRNQVTAVNSGTAALHLALLAAGIGPGDEVITSAMTFCATVNAIIHSGATPVLADIDLNTGNIDPSDIEHRITEKTRALLPVHYAGLPCDMDAIMSLARKHELIVVEDCAHAIEAEYKGKKCGTIGDFGCFSFYVTKNITTAEGGMVVSKKQEHAERIKTLSLHGMSHDAWHRFSDKGYKHYYVTNAGFKYNMTDLQAAIGIHQLARIENSWKKRKEIWGLYNRELKKLPIILPSSPSVDTRHAYHLFPIRMRQEAVISRDACLSKLTQKGVGTGVHYISIPEHPYYQNNYGWLPKDFPNAHEWGRSTLSIPLSTRLSREQTEKIIHELNSACI
ncbi:DegT/DnrJ/EryC1/StrS family aminotransferase [Thiolapillus sp.]